MDSNSHITDRIYYLSESVDSRKIDDEYDYLNANSNQVINDTLFFVGLITPFYCFKNNIIVAPLLFFLELIFFSLD